MIDRLYYVDDSGDPRFGWAVYGWVSCSPVGWRIALRKWLEFRKRLWREYSIPIAKELHATDFINGRGRLSVDPSITHWKDFGREVALECLAFVRDCSEIEVGSAVRQTQEVGAAYSAEKAALYEKVVRLWDANAADRNAFVLITMDGDGSDQSYFKAHRRLPLDTRHVIEDPIFHDSKRSQWAQIADLVAFTAYAHADRHAKNQYAWLWYEEFLSSSDPNTRPLSL